MDEVSNDDLSNVSGGYIGVDPKVESKYSEIVNKAREAYKKGKSITSALGEKDWLALNKFYGQINKSKQPWYDELQEMIESQGMGVAYDKNKWKGPK